MLAKLLTTALEKQDLAAAQALLAQMQREHPNDPNAELMAGILARLEGRLDSATSILRELHERFPVLPAIAFQLAHCEKDRGNTQRAAELYRDVLDRRPDHADAAYNLGLCQLHAHPAEAGRWFLHAARCAPDMPEAHQQTINCAGLLARRGERPESPATGTTATSPA